MIQFKPTREKHGWKKKKYKPCNITTVYGFKSCRRWIRDKFDGSRIGHRKLIRIGKDWDDSNLYTPFLDYDDIYYFLYDNLGKTYQEAWERFLKIVKPNLNKYHKNTKEIEKTFKEFLSISDRWYRSRIAQFCLDEEGKIDIKHNNLNKYKPKKVYKKYILVCNGNKVIEECPYQITKIDKKLYIFDPWTKEISSTPLSVFTISEKRWNNKKGKDIYYLKSYRRIIVPGWKINKGYFLIRNKKE